MLRPFREALPEIISGIVLAAVTGASAYFFPGGWIVAWDFAVAVLNDCWAWLAAPAEIPTGVLLVLFGCVIPIVVLPVIVIWAARSAKPSPVPPTTDEILGVVWRWSPSSYGRFDRLASFCPKCDYQVYPRDAAPFAYVHETSYLCENCKWKSQVFEVTPEEVEDRVRRELQRKARERLRKIEGK